MLTSIEQVIEQKKNKYCRQGEISAKPVGSVSDKPDKRRKVASVKCDEGKAPDRFVRRMSVASSSGHAFHGSWMRDLSSILWIEPDSCPPGVRLLYDGAKSKS
ncbi:MULTISPECIES: hypothetical protein [unclassified Phyllobacterium]|uniref:hypothetical protein n=1 Tax=Phyllobacterium TaxID=28100 RepID=UPI0013AE8C0E|nr:MULTISPECIES: hypothetical protein [unclassified Phyllobacterium]MBA8902558.1 hypothetical protein [Phyllobacterium sp. P30BS-XVII]UGX87340.1 hypothetical protein LLE53_005760 [Phyllobacterium sp. T1293]